VMGGVCVRAARRDLEAARRRDDQVLPAGFSGPMDTAAALIANWTAVMVRPPTVSIEKGPPC